MTRANLHTSFQLCTCAACFGALILSCFTGCTTASNSPEVRQREAALIPPDLYQIAPQVALAMSPLHIEFESDHFEFSGKNGCTGTLLSNGEVLTAAHAFKNGFDLSKKPPEGHFTVPNPNGGDPVEMEFGSIIYPMLVKSSAQFASVVAFRPVNDVNGDWALLAFAPSTQPLREASLLNSPHSIRFDGAKPIRRGTPLYCLGFPKTPGADPGITKFPRSMTIVQGAAERDFSSEEEIAANTTTEIDMRGMSGGPVGTYDFWTGEFTVIGIATRGSIGFKLFGQRVFWPHFVASRIPPVAMQRLEVLESSPPAAKQ